MIYLQFILMSSKQDTRGKWINNWLFKKLQFNHILRKLKVNDPNDFKSYLRMDGTTYDLLLHLIKDHVLKQNTFIREAIYSSRVTVDCNNPISWYW